MPHARSAKTSRGWHNILQEPLFHFLCIGLVLYLLFSLSQEKPDHKQIHVSASDIQRIKTSYAQQFGSPPNELQLQSLIDQSIREEIFWREGIALGLDNGDEIIRRRVAQKFEFLQQDLLIPPPPDETTLAQYFEQHRERYKEPARVSFSHIYLSHDNYSQQRLDALQKQLALNPKAKKLGDTFPGPDRFIDQTPAQLARSFGQSELVTSVFSTAIGEWSTPVQSGYGWHLLHVTARTTERIPTIEAPDNSPLRRRVLADYQQQQRQRLNEAFYRELRQQYQVSIADFKANESAALNRVAASQ